MRKLAVTVTMLLIMFLWMAFPGGALAVELGGELHVLWQGSLLDDGEFDSDLTESLDLELFLPPLGSSEVRYGFVVTKPLQGLLADEEASCFTKKLYLKHRFDDFHFTVGRQPVSWPFGSLLNPVDYTLGAVALDEETSSKYTDAVLVYVPINWNSGLDIVGSFPSGFAGDLDQLKWGVRGRWRIHGYDLTVNYVQEAK